MRELLTWRKKEALLLVPEMKVPLLLDPVNRESNASLG